MSIIRAWRSSPSFDHRTYVWRHRLVRLLLRGVPRHPRWPARRHHARGGPRLPRHGHAPRLLRLLIRLLLLLGRLLRGVTRVATAGLLLVGVGHGSRRGWCSFLPLPSPTPVLGCQQARILPEGRKGVETYQYVWVVVERRGQGSVINIRCARGVLRRCLASSLNQNQKLSGECSFRSRWTRSPLEAKRGTKKGEVPSTPSMTWAPCRATVHAAAVVDQSIRRSAVSSCSRRSRTMVIQVTPPPPVDSISIQLTASSREASTCARRPPPTEASCVWIRRPFFPV